MNQVAVLISLARHPKSGRLMLSPNDARALAVAKEMADDVRLIHVGETAHALTLRQYLGLGFPSLELIEMTDGADICEVLISYLQKDAPKVILTGLYALGQEDTGLVPYVLAEALSRHLVDRVLSVVTASNTAHQLFSRVQRRQLSFPELAILAVSSNAPPTLEFAARLSSGDSAP